MKIIFAGTPDFAAPTLQALINSHHDVIAVYTQPDRPAGRGRHMQASPVKKLALAHNIPVYQPFNFKTEDARQQLADLKPDLMVVVAYGLLLPESVLQIPQHGCMNVHASLLPRWRGAAPIQRAIETGDRETGVTIMQMDVGLDTGDMLKKVTCDIHDNDTSQQLHDRLSEMGARALIDTLTDLEHDELQPIKQDDSLATYAKKINKTEAAINWQQPAQVILQRINAFNPWPVAFTQWREKTLRVWRAETLSANELAHDFKPEEPGAIIAFTKHGLDVMCEDGVLRLTMLQLPGKRAMPAADFYNASHHYFEIGDCLV